MVRPTGNFALFVRSALVVGSKNLKQTLDFSHAPSRYEPSATRFDSFPID